MAYLSLMRNIIAVVAVLLSFSTNLFGKNPYPYAFEAQSNGITFYTLDQSYKIRKHHLIFSIDGQGLLSGNAIVYHGVSNLTLFSNSFPLIGKVYRSKKAAENLYYGRVNFTSDDGIKYYGEIKSGFLTSSNEPPKKLNLFDLRVKSSDKRVAVLTPKFYPYNSVWRSNSFSVQINNKYDKKNWIHGSFDFIDDRNFSGLLARSTHANFSLTNSKMFLGTSSYILEESPGIIDVNLQGGEWRRINFDAVSGANTSIKGAMFMKSYPTNFHYEYPVWVQLIAPLQNKRQAMVSGMGY